MSADFPIPDQTSVRGTDTNSLLRLYDRANDVLTKSVSQPDRQRAGKAVERIARELRRRKILL